MTAYYNECDPKAAAWLRQLMGADAIVRGEVDERDIRDVTPADLVGFTQCHFFAGIGGWPHALRLAGWPDERPVWTGSCPCQPFSSAGKGRGSADERHLWPAFYGLIQHARPAVIFGEQVASPAGLIWLGAVQADLEGSGYAVGVADLPAASVGAPHIRQRLFWLAQSDGGDSSPERLQRSGQHGQLEKDGRPSFWGNCDWLPCRDGKSRPVEPGTFPLAHGVPGRVGLLRGYGNAIVPQVAAQFIAAYLDTLGE